MFNFFKTTKNQNEREIEQEDSTISEKNLQNETKKDTPVHGENGACCGGCGGQ
jgi:CCGSCS motif protein